MPIETISNLVYDLSIVQIKLIIGASSPILIRSDTCSFLFMSVSVAATYKYH